VIAIAGIVDTNGKADAVRDEFAIPSDRVRSEIGAGLWLVAAAGVAEVTGGMFARRSRPA
jgi:hypothetical protein